ncbi:MAG: type I glyceraldehyde-3-phosphate dehydrogenase [Alphaproteobacteria bacterium]|nr:type I glyceraldehyde-3-phosphate dehydrogenase [Alphaproteobacteria bacterium]
MSQKWAISGFGRIGRLIFRAWLEDPNPDYHISAINAISKPELAKHLLKYDSVHGVCNVPVTIEGDYFITPHGKVALMNERDLKTINWRTHNVDIVLECSGKFNNKQAAAQHITIGGAKKILVSAPCKQADLMVVYGINHHAITAAHRVISNASCTTNCIAPLAKIMHEVACIEKGYMTTIHAYTGDQNLVDASHNDFRRARAASLSIVPTTTGAASSVSQVIPELDGRLDGCSMRVPTANVSFVDLTFSARKKVSIDELHQAIISASENELKNVLAYSDEPLVSIDFTHHPASCIFDMGQTQIISDDFIRVGAWYDNEWAFSLRMIDVAKIMGQV